MPLGSRPFASNTITEKKIVMNVSYHFKKGSFYQMKYIG